VSNVESRLDYLNGAPVVKAVIEGRPCIILVDTGSCTSLIQPDVCSAELNRTSVTPFGVTGDELRVKGKQMATFTINWETYNHEFCVCNVATDADAIVGTDFWMKMDAHLDFEKGKLRLKRSERLDQYPSTGGRYGSRGTAARAALTVLPHLDGRVKPKSCWMRREKQQIRHADTPSASSSARLRVI
jgi:hypothetical protein